MSDTTIEVGPVDKAYREWQAKIQTGHFKPTERELFNYAHAIGWKDACEFLEERYKKGTGNEASIIPILPI
jgi:hypothetical protein